MWDLPPPAPTPVVPGGKQTAPGRATMDGLAHHPEEWGGTPPSRRQSLPKKTRVPVFSGPSPVIMRAHFGAPHTKTCPRLVCPEQSQQQHNRRTPKKRPPVFFWLNEATSFQRGHQFFFLAQRGHFVRSDEYYCVPPQHAEADLRHPQEPKQGGGGATLRVVPPQMLGCPPPLPTAPRAVQQCTAGVPLPFAPRRCGGVLREYHRPLPQGTAAQCHGQSTAHCPKAVSPQEYTAHCPRAV